MTEKQTTGWAADLSESGTPCVYPLGDLRSHKIESEDCWCRPYWDGHILVHNSMDKREQYEKGRKFS